MSSQMKTASVMLKDYLGKKDLTEHLRLSKDITFHWANWDMTCRAQRRHYKNFNNNYHLNRLNDSLMKLKDHPIWLCNRYKVIKTDMFSLYESYLDSRLRLTWFERKEEILFSHYGEQGPFQSLTTMKWMDKETYAKFIMRKILLEHSLLRTFRLNTTIPIHLKLSNEVKTYKDCVSLHQISEQGFILCFKKKNILNKLQYAKSLELKVPLKPFLDNDLSDVVHFYKILDGHEFSMDKDALVFKMDASILNKYDNVNNSKRAAAEEFYIYAQYEDLIPDNHSFEIKSILLPLVEKTKNFFALDLTEIENDLLEIKKAA